MTTPIRTVFLVGNGASRRGFLLSTLRDKGLIVGCNLAYRDFPDFDVIVSIDLKPSKFTLREYKGLHLFNNSFKTDDIFCNSLSYVIGKLPKLKDKLDSGKLAAYLSKHFLNADRLIMIGMDFGGKDLYSNDFESRPNFIEDWNSILNQFKEVIRVTDSNDIKELNTKNITYNELEEVLCG